MFRENPEEDKEDVSEVNFWNDLTNKVVDAPSIKPFNNILDKFWTTLNIKYKKL